MIALFLMVATPANAAAPAGTDEVRPARHVMERQLQSPPRPDTRPSLSADEADAIRARYLASIGKTLERSTDDGPGAAR